jgi:hypothetical protein
MTFVRKFNGKTEQPNNEPIVAVYTCPEHGAFDCEVRRNEIGEAPDVITCDELEEDGCRCELEATWTPSAVSCRVRRVEVVRGKWEKPERNTYLDTRKLGEGQDPAEFQAERKKMWREKRMRELKDL